MTCSSFWSTQHLVPFLLLLLLLLLLFIVDIGKHAYKGKYAISNSKFYKKRFLSKSTENKIEYMNTILTYNKYLILFSTAVNAVFVAKLLTSGILFSNSVSFVFLTNSVRSGILFSNSVLSI